MVDDASQSAGAKHDRREAEAAECVDRADPAIGYQQQHDGRESPEEDVTERERSRRPARCRSPSKRQQRQREDGP